LVVCSSAPDTSLHRSWYKRTAAHPPVLDCREHAPSYIFLLLSCWYYSCLIFLPTTSTGLGDRGYYIQIKLGLQGLAPWNRVSPLSVVTYLGFQLIRA
jgi:hypothetical protein